MGTTKQEIQRELLKDAFAAAGRPVEIGAGPGRDADAEFLYETGRLLVREEHLPAVRDILTRLYLLPARRSPEPERDAAQERRRPAEQPGTEPVIAGVRAIRLEFRPDRPTASTTRSV